MGKDKSAADEESGVTSATLAATMKMLKPEVPIAICSAEWEASPEDARVADVFITEAVAVDELLDAIKSLLRKDRSAKAA